MSLSQCVARNLAGEDTLRVTLKVRPRERVEAPRFVERPEQLTVAEGSAAEFRCRATGAPVPQFSWTALGAAVEPGRFPGVRVETLPEAEPSGGRSSLLFDAVRPTHAGWVQVTVANVAGSITARARLVVLGVLFIQR